MARISMNEIVGISVALILIAVVMPLGIGLLSAADQTVVTINGTGYALSELADSTVITLLTILIPIMAVIAVVLGFMPRFRN